MGFLSRLFGPRKRKRAAAPRVKVSIKQAIARSKKPRQKFKAAKEPRVFVFYDKDDPTVPGTGYRWFVVSAPNRGSAKRALEARIGKGSEADHRMRGPLPQNQVASFLKNDAPRETVTRLKGT